MSPPSKSGILLAALTFLTILAPAPAVAHERGDQAMGVVVSVSAEQIVIEAPDGHPVTFTVTSETVFVRGERPAVPGDVRIGERAVVQGKPLGKAMQAVRVRLGPAPAAK